MRYVEVGGARLSSVGLGTWQFGSREWGYGQDYVDNQAGPIVARALDLGITLFDTAELYGFGQSERILGEALGHRRSEAFVASKLFPVMPVRPVIEHRARASAARLGTDFMDLYQLHQPNPTVPLAHTMEVLGELVEEGLIRHVGVSNYSLTRWRAAEDASPVPVLSNQVRYNLIDRRPETDLLPWAQSHDRLIIAYSPLAQGLLSGRYDAGHKPSGVVRRASPAFTRENLERVSPLLEVLRSVARSHDATPAQVALAWLVRRPNVVVIPGAGSVAQLEANAAAADLELTEDDDVALTCASSALALARTPELMSHMARSAVDRGAPLARRAVAMGVPLARDMASKLSNMMRGGGTSSPV